MRKYSVHKDWFIYQERICEHLNQLGFNASTNKTIQGVRTKHDLDIYAEIFMPRYLLLDKRSFGSLKQNIGIKKSLNFMY